MQKTGNRLFMALSFFLLPFTSRSQEIYPDTAYCPIDSTPVLFWRTMSMTTHGSLLDFEKLVDVPDYYANLVAHCPRCLYSGYFADFQKSIPHKQTDSIRKFLHRFAKGSVNDALECEIAAGLHRLEQDRNERIAYIYLEGSYLLRSDTLRKKNRIFLQEQSVLYMKKALRAGEILPENKVTAYYLIGDLNRRIGNFDEALDYFSKARPLVKEQLWIEPMLDRSEKMARAKDDNNLL